MPIHQWDDLRLFLAVARAGKLLAAARLLGLDHTTVARRLTAFEEAIGTRLLDRSPRGAALTAAGRALVEYAERIEGEVEAATASLGQRDATISGIVRLATPEAFGSFLIAPNAALLHARHPELQLELAPESRLVSLVNREADIAVALQRPPSGRLVARRLIDYRLGLYASVEYLARHGPVTSVAALSGHPFAWYIDAMIDIPELRVLGEIAADARPVFRSSSIAAQQSAVAGGLGIGVLHAFTADSDPRLVRVLADEVEVRRSYWLVLHEDQQRLPRVRAVIDFLDEIVARYRDRF
jgi:DNA-binding transcriptional LysR family regulator